MRANALRKQPYIQDNVQPLETPQYRRARIAAQAEEACNADSADLETFANQYGLDKSAFA